MIDIDEFIEKADKHVMVNHHVIEFSDKTVGVLMVALLLLCLTIVLVA